MKATALSRIRPVAIANPSYARTGQHGVPGTRFHLDHRFVRRCLSAYLDGELEPPQRQRVEHHLVECENCGRTCQALVRILAGLRGLGARPRRDLARRAIERLHAEEVPQHDGADRLP